MEEAYTYTQGTHQGGDTPWREHIHGKDKQAAANPTICLARIMTGYMRTKKSTCSFYSFGTYVSKQNFSNLIMYQTGNPQQLHRHYAHSELNYSAGSGILVDGMRQKGLTCRETCGENTEGHRTQGNMYGGILTSPPVFLQKDKAKATCKRFHGRLAENHTRDKKRVVSKGGRAYRGYAILGLGLESHVRE